MTTRLQQVPNRAEPLNSMAGNAPGEAIRAKESVVENRATMEALHAAENEGWKSVPLVTSLSRTRPTAPAHVAT